MRLFAVTFARAHFADLAEATRELGPGDASTRGEERVEGAAGVSGENVEGFADQFRVQECGGKFLGGRVVLARVEFESPQFRDDAEMSEVVWMKGSEQVGHG